MDWKGLLAIAIGIAVITFVIRLVLIPVLQSAPDLRVKEVHEEQTGGTILLHYEVWGKVFNNGTLSSGPVTVRLNITSSNGALLFNADRPIFPDIRSPKDNGSFTFKFTSDDLGGYTGLCKNGKDIPVSNVSVDGHSTTVPCT